MPRTGWLAAGAGIAALVVGSDEPRLLLALVAVSGLLLAVGAWLPRGRRMAVFAVGIGMLSIALRAGVGPHDASLSGSPVDDGPWSMAVETVGSPRDGHQVATLRTLEGAPGFRLAATLPRYPIVEPGDRVAVTGRTRPRPDSAYGRYLERLGAWGTLDARSMTVLARPVDPGTLLEGWRRDAGELLTRVLPEPEAGLAAGILIGLRDRVDREVAADFTTAGVSHVVAISGWNIAIVAAAVAALAGRLGRRRRAVITAVAIAVYILFAGASPSVLRAGAMAGVVLVARESGRSGRAAAALGLAAFVLLLAEPALVSDAGFQLSTLATAGLVAWATPVTERLDRWTRHRLPGWLIESLGVSLAAQAATLPIVLASFGRLALISPVVNLLVVPLVTPAMAAGIVAFLGGVLVSVGAPTAVGAILAAPGWVALRLMIGIVEVGASMPLASVTFEPVVGATLGVACAAGAGAIVLVRRRGRRWSGSPTHSARGHEVSPSRSRRDGPPRSMAARLATVSLVVAVAIAGAVVVTRPSGVAHITILDVGQGDAILVEGSLGGRLLIDGGPDPDRLLVELDRRIPPWDRRLDAIVLSHPHEDHVAGLALLLDRYRVGRVLEPGMRGPGPGYGAWLARLARPGAPPRLSIAAGDRLTVDDIAMRVLWPIRGRVPAEPPDTGTGINNVSVVLLGAVGGRRFLLAGDVEQDVDPSLLTEGLPHVDLLKVAHHGSKTATTDAFLAAVRPRIAVASAGTGNPYGHPAPRTLERLAATGARVYRTDVDGSVTVTFEASGLAVRTDPRRGAAIPASAVTAAAPPVDGPRRTYLCDIPAPKEAAAGARPSSPPVGAPPPWLGASATAEPIWSAARVGFRLDDLTRSRFGRGPVDMPRNRAKASRPRKRHGRGPIRLHHHHRAAGAVSRWISACAFVGAVGAVAPRLRAPPHLRTAHWPPPGRPLDGRASAHRRARPSRPAHSGSVVSVVGRAWGERPPARLARQEPRPVSATIGVDDRPRARGCRGPALLA